MKAAWRPSHARLIGLIAALLPLLFSTGCSVVYIVDIENLTDVPVVIELSLYDDYYGKRPLAFTADLLEETRTVTVDPGEIVEEKYYRRKRWVVWRQVEPPFADAPSGVLDLHCDCSEITLGQKSWNRRAAAALRSGIRRFFPALLGGYAVLWSLALLGWPRWTLRQRWSLVGSAADEKPVTRYRVLAVVCFCGLLLYFVPTGVPRHVGELARRSTWLLALLSFFTWAVVSAFRALVGPPRRLRGSPHYAGFLRNAGFRASTRRASLVALLIASLGFGMTREVLRGGSRPNLAPYDAFYALPFEEQRIAVQERSFEEQLDIYLVGERQCGGSRLESELVLNAARIVPAAADRLEESENWFEIQNILGLLLWLEGSGAYPVADSDELMLLLDRRFASRDADVMSYSHRELVDQIREHGELRRRIVPALAN